MTRRTKTTAEAPGQDSFLDIVANLVGILIILVMVVGVRAKDALLEAAPVQDPQQDEEALLDELDDARSASSAVESDIHQLDQDIQRQGFEIAYRRNERDKIQLLVATAEAELEKRRSQLNESQQHQFDAQRNLMAANQELADLERGIQAAENSTAPVAVIEHLPTPMAKTVFGKELHFRLKDGRISYVPWDELTDQLKTEAPQKLWRLKDQPEMTETLGPIGGFWMKYTLKRVEHRLETKVGTAVRRGVELYRFVLIPVAEDIGESVDEALQPDSQMQAILANHRPNSATVTIWTYPDSFNEFRTIKQALFQRGYLTASRPLPTDHPIGGSPHGSRSAAQ